MKTKTGMDTAIRRAVNSDKRADPAANLYFLFLSPAADPMAHFLSQSRPCRQEGTGAARLQILPVPGEGNEKSNWNRKTTGQTLA
jgi:hypothetical protein